MGKSKELPFSKEEEIIVNEAYKLADNVELSALNPRQSLIEFFAYFFKLVILGKASFGDEIHTTTLRRMRGAAVLLLEELQAQENQQGENNGKCK